MRSLSEVSETMIKAHRHDEKRATKKKTMQMKKATKAAPLSLDLSPSALRESYEGAILNYNVMTLIAMLCLQGLVWRCCLQPF